VRNISFFLTQDQIRAGTKTVTRRLGWWDLKRGEDLCAVVKGQGLRKGESIERIRIIEVVNASPQSLRRMITHREWGDEEAAREGFPDLTGPEFVEMFCDHMTVRSTVQVNRIEFKYECTCCERGGLYNGFGSDGPLLFTCPDHCPCHD